MGRAGRYVGGWDERRYIHTSGGTSVDGTSEWGEEGRYIWVGGTRGSDEQVDIWVMG